MATVQIKALRNVVIGPGRSVLAGELAVVDALIAATLLAQLAAELVHESDRPALREALIDDVKRQAGGRLGPRPGSPWRPHMH